MHRTLKEYILGDFTLSWVLGGPMEKVTLMPVLFGSHGQPGI